MVSIRTLIADDHAAFRATLREFLEGMEKVVVIGEAGDGREAVSLTSRLRPDLVIMDIHMPGLDGREACRAIKLGNADQLVLLYSMDRTALMGGCRDCGADRCIAKDDLFAELQGLEDWVGSFSAGKSHYPAP